MTSEGGVYRLAGDTAEQRLAAATERLAHDDELMAASFQDGRVVMRRERNSLELCHTSIAGTDARGRRIELEVSLIRRLVLERNATQLATRTKLVIDRQDGERVPLLEVDGRVPGARLKRFAIAFASWLGKSLDIDESAESMARMRRADEDEGIDVRSVPGFDGDAPAVDGRSDAEARGTIREIGEFFRFFW